MQGIEIRKLILLRLLFGVLLLFAPQAPIEGTPQSFYATSALICPLSLFYLLWYVTGRRLYWLALVQIFTDIVLETFLVVFTGGSESLFTIFYVLTILSAAFIVGKKNVVVGATFASCLGYLTASFVSQELKLSAPLPIDAIYFFYGVTVKIVIFLAAGQLARLLGQRVIDLQDQLKLSERLSLLGETVSKVAHEIRNPLASITTAAEVLGDSLKGRLNQQEERMVTIIGNESDHLAKTLQRILNYARKVKPNCKTLLLDSMIEKTLNLVRLNSQLQHDSIVVEKKYDPMQTHIYADEEQILSALLNLTLNAFQAMPSGGTFRIAGQEDLRGTSLSLEDSGQGIPPEQMKDLFLPFRSSKKGGTGLGLAEVYKIVTLHEGKIKVESYRGKGTTFSIYLPKP
ncbi:MAG: hypothetical protein HY447_04555 [Candidatus Omnitrophica bacterium]|nr:hypothetical protein [Candidatus Omnitrophota bacterium]